MILIVEDNRDDLMLLRRALRNLGPGYRCRIASSGEEAMEYLNGFGAYADREQFPLPQLIFLDLRLPGVDGFEVLRWLRAHEDLKHIPVVVITVSTFSPDVKRAYQLGANTFIVKPVDPAAYETTLKQVVDYWLMKTILPDQRAVLEAEKAGR